MKILAQTMKDGSVRIVEAPSPLIAPGFVRVRTVCSAISPGTEGNKIVTGRMSLIGKARAKPDQVKQVLAMVGQLGLKHTIQKVRDKLDGAEPLGYSLAGVVTEIGPEVEHVAAGRPGRLRRRRLRQPRRRGGRAAQPGRARCPTASAPRRRR